MAGIVVLMGGDEFRPPCREMDQALLALSARRPPRVVVLPTAAARERPELAAANGVRYFQGLGAQASAAMVLHRADAEDEDHARALADADLIYLAGGSPFHLIETLRDSLIWRVVRERHAQGAIVAGSSAGAMALASFTRVPGHGWAQALGLVAGVGVLPHHERAGQESAERLAEAWRLGRVVFGIDGATAAVARSDGWHVLGVGRVTVYRPTGEPRVYTAGERFEIT